MHLTDCHNTEHFRKFAKQRLPSPIFHYIDGAADDEVTYRRNTEAFETCDLVPNVLAGVENIDMSTTVMGQKLELPLFLSPTALQRLFHHDGERAVGKAAEKFGTMFGISSLATVSIEEIGSMISTPKLFQLYVHKDKELTKSMIDRCKDANFEAMALTVDTIVGGNRERDLHTGLPLLQTHLRSLLVLLRTGVGSELFFPGQIRAFSTKGFRSRRDQYSPIGRRLFQHYAGSIYGLESG